LGQLFALRRTPTSTAGEGKALRIFIDSSIWFAAANIRENRNARAKHLLASISERVMTDHILVETWLLLNGRIGRHAAEEFWHAARHGAAEIEKVGMADLETAWAIGELFPYQDFSIVDRTSFAVMERVGITHAASFDDHFAVYRFGRDRRRAFEILR
jgi:predicted nucleic acid-binding protein